MVSKLDLWICMIGEYLYDPCVGDPDNGVEAGTSFLSLLDEWKCPNCGAEKDEFVTNLKIAEFGISEEIEHNLEVKLLAL